MAAPTLAHALGREAARRQSPMLPAAGGSPHAAGAGMDLGPGCLLSFSGYRFVVTEALGEGSFGTVWAASGEGAAAGLGEVAVKEIPCRSEGEISRVAVEGRLMQLAERALAATALDARDRVPTLVASEVVQAAGQQKWRVRFVMTRLQGTPLESFLVRTHRAEKARSPCSFRELRHQFALACRYSGELLVQLAPALEAISTAVYHRDVTPRNILVDAAADPTHPQFSLVDFGLAVDASKWRSADEGTGDLGGDGRYWPASAWFVFGYGTQALEQRPVMSHEYRTCLDVHSLGITALRCLMEMLPQIPDASVGDLPEVHAAVPRLRSLRAAWGRYWSDAKRFWQPVYDAFRGTGEFEALRTAYVRAGVHEIIAADLLALRSALAEARQSCERLPSDTGLAGMAALFDALLLMVQAGDADPALARLPPPTPVDADASPMSRYDASPCGRAARQSQAGDSDVALGRFSGAQYDTSPMASYLSSPCHRAPRLSQAGDSDAALGRFSGAQYDTSPMASYLSSPCHHAPRLSQASDRDVGLGCFSGAQYDASPMGHYASSACHRVPYQSQAPQEYYPYGAPGQYAAPAFPDSPAKLPRWNSVSTGVPDSSPPSSAASGRDLDYFGGDRDLRGRGRSPSGSPRAPAPRAPRLSEAWGAEMARQRGWNTQHFAP